MTQRGFMDHFRLSRGKKGSAAPGGQLVIAIIAAMSLLLTPMTARAGAGLPHAHAFLTLLIDGADGKFDHHEFEAANHAAVVVSSPSFSLASISHPVEKIVNAFTIDGTLVVPSAHGHGAIPPVPLVESAELVPVGPSQTGADALPSPSGIAQSLTPVPIANFERGAAAHDNPDTPSLENSVPAVAGIAFLAPDIVLVLGPAMGFQVWPRLRLLSGRAGPPLSPPPRPLELISF